MEKKMVKARLKKDFNDYSKHHQKRIKHQLKEELQTTRSFLHGLYNLTPKLIKLSGRNLWTYMRI